MARGVGTGGCVADGTGVGGGRLRCFPSASDPEGGGRGMSEKWRSDSAIILLAERSGRGGYKISSPSQGGLEEEEEEGETRSRSRTRVSMGGKK